MANLKLQKNGYLYLIHWITPERPLKISTGVKLEPSQWDAKNQRITDTTLKNSDGEKLADIVMKYSGAMASALQEVKVTRKDLKVTFYDHLKGELKRGGPLAVTSPRLLEYFEARVKLYEADKKSNCKSYRTTYNNLAQFLKRRRPTLDELNVDFFEDFKRFLEKEKNYKKNSVACQIKNLKAVLRYAYIKKLTRNSDFRDVKAKKEPSVNIALSLEELEKIYKLNFEKYPSIDRVRDSFIVGCFTGLRFEDWGRVRAEFVKDGILTIKATKTGETSQIPIHKYVKAILEKYNGVMPAQISNQKTNAAIKIICRCAGLNQGVEKQFTKGGMRSSKPKIYRMWQMCSTHTARRSLCTNLIIEGANAYVVMKISGHTSLQSFEKYIDKRRIGSGANLKALPMFNA